MTEQQIKELLGHMVIQMRMAEIALEQKSARIAELEAEVAKLKPPSEPEHPVE